MTTSYLIETLSKDKLSDKTIINNLVVKGQLIKSTLESIQTICGEENLNLILSKLEIPQQIALKKCINIKETYPLHLLIDLNLQLESIIGKTDNEIIHKLGKSDFESLFSSFEKFKLKFLSTSTIIELVAKKLNSFFSPTKFKVESISSNHTNIIICNFFDPSNLMQERFIGFLKATLINSGKTNSGIQFQKSDEDYCYQINCIW